jgi:hypothetical protein
MGEGIFYHSIRGIHAKHGLVVILMERSDRMNLLLEARRLFAALRVTRGRGQGIRWCAITTQH